MYAVLEYQHETVKHTDHVHTVDQAVAWAIENAGAADVLKVFTDNGNRVITLNRKDWVCEDSEYQA